MYLRICPTEHLKRFLVSGYPAVYEIAKNFRPGNESRKHLPEFSSLECTVIDTTYADMMVLAEELICNTIIDVTGSLEISWQGNKVSFEMPWDRVSIRDAVFSELGIDLDDCLDFEALRSRAVSKGVSIAKRHNNFGELLDDLVDVHVLPRLCKPTFLVDYPWLLGGPAAPLGADHKYKQRAELFLGNFEIANLSTHLSDPSLISEWYARTLEDKRSAGCFPTAVDEPLMSDLASGIPQAAILGIGLDRLLMLVHGCDDIADVVAYTPFALTYK